MKEYIAEEEQTLRDFTDSHCAPASFYWNYLIKNREIRINGKKTGGNVRLCTGDKVAYYLTPAQESRTGFSVLYEDGDVCVTDKENGVNSEAVFCALCEKGEYFFIHRIDRNTSGVMIFGKNERAEKELLRAFRERKAEKVYLAICCDRFRDDEGRLTGWLKKDADRARVRVYSSPVAGGEEIVTSYRVAERRNGLALAEVTLHTGKTHQIRAHLAHIGCPVVGDMKYGDESLNRRFRLTRQLLTAKKLTLHTDGALAYLSDRTFLSSFAPAFPEEA